MKCLKAFGFLLLSCFLFFGLSPLKQVKASVSSFNQTYNADMPIKPVDPTTGNISYWKNAVYFVYYKSRVSTVNGTVYNPGFYTWVVAGSDPIYYNGNYIYDSDWSFYLPNWVIYDDDYSYTINIRGSFNFTPTFDSWDDFIDDITPDPTWWEIIKNKLIDIAGDIALGDKLKGFIDVLEWGLDLWTVKVGEGEPERWEIDVEPPPSPTPLPTPIPYQTVMTPDNNGGFTIQYIYNNPSGTPEAHPQPPANVTNTTNNYGDDFEYPYYENPENKDNPFRLKIPWYLKLILNNNDIPIDTLDDHYDVAQYQVQSDDVLEAVDTVYDGFQVIPSDWILLLGAIACLPLFAALIHRMLSG